MPRFSANLGFLWPDRPLLDRIEAAADAGFPAVEFHWPFDVSADAVRAACERRGLVATSLNTPFGNPGEFGLGAVPGRENDFQVAVDQAIAYARAAHIGAIHAMAGVVAAQDRDRARDVLIRNLQRATAKAPEITFLIEPINPNDRPGYFYHCIDDALSIIEAVGAPNLKLMFDAYHVARGEGDVITRLNSAFPHIGHVQIAAVPSRAEPDEGEIAYGAIFAALDRLGYSGFVACEYKPRAGTDAGLTWMRALASPA
jgi:hydroxypyruvate isomerase